MRYDCCWPIWVCRGQHDLTLAAESNLS